MASIFKPLGQNLSHDEKMYLATMASHRGFEVQKKMMEEACRQATDRIVLLDPEDPTNDEKIKRCQLTARIVNDFCATLIKSIWMHTEAGKLEEQQKKISEALQEEAVVEEGSTVLGSARIKSRAPQVVEKQ